MGSGQVQPYGSECIAIRTYSRFDTLGVSAAAALVRAIGIDWLVERLAAGDLLFFSFEKGQARLGRLLQLLRFGVGDAAVRASRFDGLVEKVEE